MTYSPSVLPAVTCVKTDPTLVRLDRDHAVRPSAASFAISAKITLNLTFAIAATIPLGRRSGAPPQRRAEARHRRQLGQAGVKEPLAKPSC